MRHKIQVLLAGLGLGLCATVGFSATAYADTTCYTGCSTPLVTTAPPTTPSTSSLAFTGADIDGIVAVGGGAVAVGGLLVVGGRRRRTAKYHRAAE